VSNLILDYSYQLFQLVDRFWDGYRFGVAEVYCGALDAFDLGPEGGAFFVVEAVFVDLDQRFALHHPREHGDQVEDEEGRREQEITDALADVKGEDHRQEKHERQHDDKHRPLQICRGDAVDGNEPSEIFVFVAH